MLKNLLPAFLLVIFITSAIAQSEENSNVKDIVASPADSLQKLSNQIEAFSDTLNPKLSIKTTSLDSIKQNLNYRIDSLNKLQLPTDQYSRLLDSLNQLGALKILDPAENGVTDAQTKADALTEKLTSPVDKLEQAVNDKLNLMKKEGGDGANLPNNLDLTQPGSTNLDLPELNIGQPQIESGGLKGQIPNLPSIDKNLPAVEGLKDINKGMSDVKAITTEVAGYGEDIKNVTSGNLEEVNQIPEKLESEAVKNVDAEALQEHERIVDQYQELVASGNDPEALKKQALLQATKLATNHFKGKEEVLQQAIDKVNSYKSKYTELTGLENIPRRQPNEMKGKPLVERLVPGITLQIQNTTDFWLDYNLALGYRVTKRFTTGLGWNERVGITNKISFTTKDRVYGPRTFLEYKLKRGFALRSDVEKMNVYVPPFDFGPSGFWSRQWKWGVFIGMKKEYDFIKSVKGNFQFLYNVYDDQGQSPYLSRFMVRFGFEFPMRKKEKNQ